MKIQINKNNKFGLLFKIIVTEKKRTNNIQAGTSQFIKHISKSI